MSALAVAEDAEKLTKDLSMMLKKMEGKMADILQLMEPVQGKTDDVDAESDIFMELQTDIEKCVAALMEAMKKVKSDLSDESIQAAAPDKRGGVAGSSANVSFGEGVHDAREERIHQRPAHDAPLGSEMDELRKNLTAVTQREKERVEGLQSQIELARQELAESRSQRRLEQATLAASESQASQLRAALTCAEDDLKSLRDALDQELVRSHRLQNTVTQLEEELKVAHHAANQFQQQLAMEDRSKGETTVDSTGFHSYMAERRQELEGPGKTRPGSRGGGRPMSAGRVRPHKSDASFEEPPSREGGDARREYARAAGERGNRSVAEAPEAARPRRPRPTSAPIRNSAARTAGSKAGGGGVSATRRLDTSSMSFLRSHVMSGHVTRQTPLQIAVEYCGRSSFSVRHNEAKYTQLAEQLASVAYEHFKDRRMTVLKNSEVPPDAEAPRPPRLGAFEIELLWTDSNRQPRRTLLHSKLHSRVFPNVARVVEDLADTLDPRPREDEVL